MSESVYICAQDVKNVLHAKAARRYTIALPLQKAELYENIIEEVPYQALLLFPALRRFCLKREFLSVIFADKIRFCSNAVLKDAVYLTGIEF